MLDFKSPFTVDIQDSDWQMFVDAKSKSVREQMAVALLVGLGCNHLLLESIEK
jgi:hypothetical protein